MGIPTLPRAEGHRHIATKWNSNNYPEGELSARSSRSWVAGRADHRAARDDTADGHDRHVERLTVTDEFRLHFSLASTLD
ncbi:hypothetical protein LG293_01920 [Citricoccus nitrophenolicus]